MKEENVLKSISKAVAEFIKKDKLSTDKCKELEKEHNECINKINGVNKQMEKMKLMEK